MLCVFLQMTVSVHANIMQRSNGQPLSQPELSRPKGNYTGKRLKLLRPQAYRRVVELLAEPREHVSIREICRQCHVTDDTVKAVEKRGNSYSRTKSTTDGSSSSCCQAPL